MELTCRVPQGSVLRPLLWNIAFDVVFWLPMPRGTTAIDCVDDTLVVAEGDTVEAVQELANAALKTVSDHILGLGLCLSVVKIQAVVFTRHYGASEPLILLEEEVILLGASLKYLGVVLERKGMMFGAHLRAAADKAQRVMGALGKLIPTSAARVRTEDVCFRALCTPCFFTVLRHGLL